MTDAFEKVTRNMVENLKETMESGFSGINYRLEKIESTQRTLFNHQSGRIPKDVANKMSWLTGILGVIIGGILVGLAVSLLTG